MPGRFGRFRPARGQCDSVPNREAWLERIERLILDVRGDEPTDLVGLGVACRGIIDPETTTVLRLPGVLHELQGERLDQILSPISAGLPIRAENDAKAALLGECWTGAAAGLRDVVLLTLGTHVGGGLLVDGRIVRGRHHAAAHLGHWTLDPNGPPCHCGNRGCLTQYFSATALRRRSEGLEATEVFARARRGEVRYHCIVSEAIDALAAALAGMAHALDPERIVLVGGLTDSAVDWLEPLRRSVASRTGGWLETPPPVVLGRLGDAAGCVGAVRGWFAEGRFGSTHPGGKDDRSGVSRI